MSVFEPISRSHGGFVDILQVGPRRCAQGLLSTTSWNWPTTTPRAGRWPIPPAYIPRTLRAVLQDRRRLPAPDCLSLGASLAAGIGRAARPRAEPPRHQAGQHHLRRRRAQAGRHRPGGCARAAVVLWARRATSRRKAPAARRRTFTAWARCSTRRAMGRDRLDFPDALPATWKPSGPDHGPIVPGAQRRAPARLRSASRPAVRGRPGDGAPTCAGYVRGGRRAAGGPGCGGARIGSCWRRAMLVGSYRRFG